MYFLKMNLLLYLCVYNFVCHHLSFEYHHDCGKTLVVVKFDGFQWAKPKKKENRHYLLFHCLQNFIRSIDVHNVQKMSNRRQKNVLC